MNAFSPHRADLRTAALCVALALTVTARASEAETSARASAGRQLVGTAAGTARYQGDVGFARTDTRSGSVTRARSVAVGLDQDGLSFSLSTAVATRRGPALATSFNMSIDSDGSAALGFGNARAAGGSSRTVEAGGRTSTGPAGATAVATAGAKTQGGGAAYARSHSTQQSRFERTPRRFVQR